MYFFSSAYCILILPVVQYGCQTWSLTLREEYRKRMFENRVMKKTAKLKREEAKESV